MPSARPPARTVPPSATASSTQRWVRARLPGVDHRADVGRRVERVADLQRLDALEELGHERVPDRLVDEHPLDADADLARRRRRRRPAMRLTAQSRSAVWSTMTPALPPSSSTTFFLPARSFIRQPTLGLPVKVSSLKRSSATIRSPSSRVIGRMLTIPAGTPAASTISATVEHRQRVLGRRLEDDRVAAGDGRRELVRGQVEREVERADGRDRADREAPGDADPVLGCSAAGRAG